MNDKETYTLFQDIKDYTVDFVHGMQNIVIKGLVVCALTMGTANISHAESFKYDIPTDKYEFIDSHLDLMNWMDLIVDKNENTDYKQSIYDNLWGSLHTKYKDMMDIAYMDEAREVLAKISKLPIQRSCVDYNPQSSAMFISMQLPEDLLISTTRYLKGDDKDLYFSVKGKGQLLFTGFLSADEFVSCTFEALKKIGWKA